MQDEKKKTNHERLEEAGLTNPNMQPKQEHIEAINALSEEDVDALIRVHKLLSKSDAHQIGSAYIVPEGGRFPRV